MLTLRTRLTLCFVLLIGGVGLAYGVYISTLFADQLEIEVHKRGETLAHHLAEIGADAVVSEDRLALHSLIHSVQKAESDLAYIYFLDHDGDRILADSFDGHFPLQLLNSNPIPSGTPISRRELQLDGLAIYDIGAEVLSARAGFVHIGLSTQPIKQAVGSLITHALIALMLFTLAAISAAGPIARSISRPIVTLTAAVRQIGAGRTEHIEIGSRDEIGELAAAYNTMVDNLTQTQGALKAQLDFREALLNDLPEAVYYKDTSGRLLGCSRVFAEFFGSTPQELAGRTADELFIEPQKHLDRDAELVTGSGGVITYEALVRRHDNAIRNIVFFKTLFNDAHGAPIIISVMQDVTKEREADRLKSEFVSAVAHEFQTPLATVLGFAELILDRGIDGEQRAEGLRQIMDKAERLSHLVDELLDLSRIETGRRFSLHNMPCSLREIIEGVTEDFRHSACSHLFRLRLPEGGLPLTADPERISQVLENLLSNAVKYSPKGSTIAIEVDEGAEAYRIQIRDSGRGMTPEQAERAFDKFYRADTSDTAPAGTGLGLYLAQSLTAMHGGDITLDSRPGAGTCAIIALPKTAVNSVGSAN